MHPNLGGLVHENATNSHPPRTNSYRLIAKSRGRVAPKACFHVLLDQLTNPFVHESFDILKAFSDHVVTPRDG